MLAVPRLPLRAQAARLLVVQAAVVPVQALPQRCLQLPCPVPYLVQDFLSLSVAAYLRLDFRLAFHLAFRPGFRLAFNLAFRRWRALCQAKAPVGQAGQRTASPLKAHHLQ